MRRLIYLWLFLAGLLVNLAVAAFEHSAGYMDADYYYAGGIRLAQGHGFSEMVLWNYLDDPSALPHPSHGYWYPLASLIAAAGMLAGGSTAYPVARLGFILIGALMAPVTAALALRLSARLGPLEAPRPELAITAGALALFPSYLLAFVPATDNYGIFVVCGGLFFLLADRGRRLDLLLAGVLAGLMSLARSDGLIWAGAGLLFIGLRSHVEAAPEARAGRRGAWLVSSAIFLAGFAVLALPWYGRNLAVFGSPLAPGGGRAFFLRDYADTFAFPASRLTFPYLLSAGWKALAGVRWQALLSNLDATLTIQVGLILLPFAAIGLWRLRRQTIVQVGWVVWLLLMLAMSLLFPFAGPRGSYTHAGAALYPLWWSVAAAGLGIMLDWLERRGFHRLAARRNLVLFAVVAVCAILSGYLAYVRISLLDWDRFARVYPAAEQRLVADGASPGTPVIVIDPPAYFTTTGRPALVIPDEDESHLLALADRFGARYLLLEKEHLGEGDMKRLYETPDAFPGFELIGQVEDAKLYRIEH